MRTIFRAQRLAYIAAEKMCAFYQATLVLHLGQMQIEDLFRNNARRLFGV